MTFTVKEACDALGIKVGASNEELQKAFKASAVKYHPDKNNGDDAQFKKINGAYQFLKQNGTQEIPTIKWDYSRIRSPQVEVEDFINAFINSKRRNSNIINKTLNLTFKESVIGVDKEIALGELIKCESCDGIGELREALFIPCNVCEGKGTFEEPDVSVKCSKCKGTGNRSPDCDKCEGRGQVFTKHKVHIPGGVVDGNAIKKQFNNNIYVFTITIEKDPDMQKNGLDVVSSIEISLLEALKGVTKEVRTIKGSKALKIPKGFKNKDLIRVKNHGVPPFGAHLFLVNVKYPEDTASLISLLEEREKEKI